ncbi:Fic family protein [Mycoplasmopsis caviae]|uniref:Fic family protein n=1 Tax=Mycoplasmopsis caviae TaxID=55603 RepID=A0A3P8L6Q4_9BACT|nr:Fic family protein [Mycoplasmopsis caviae]UUD35534.1 Fic family protein [Mycoplasmopsis caviae]VDR41695.1 Fic/DOC family [Mycoplasmopsis caviae]
MKNINYKRIFVKGIDLNIVNLLTQIHEYKGRQNIYINNKKNEINKLMKQSLIDSSIYSNKIEEIEISNKRIKDILIDNEAPKSDAEEDIKGYYQVLNNLFKAEEIQLNPNFLLDLHYQLFQYSNSKVKGRFKLNDNYFLETTLEGQKEIKFIPTKSFLINDFVSSMCNKFNELKHDNKQNIVLPSIAFILDFLCISPFNYGNNRISRILLNYLLNYCGFAVVKYVSLEKIIYKNHSQYQNILQKSSYKWFENQNNYFIFIEFILKIILQVYKEFESLFTTLEYKKIDVAKEIVKLLLKFKKLSKNELICLLPESSKRTIERYLNSLLKNNLISKTGIGKSTKYTIKQANTKK